MRLRFSSMSILLTIISILVTSCMPTATPESLNTITQVSTQPRQLPIFVRISGCVSESAIESMVDYYDAENFNRNDRNWSFTVAPSLLYNEKPSFFTGPASTGSSIPPVVVYFPTDRILEFNYLCLQPDKEAEYQTCYDLRAGQCPNGFVNPPPAYDPPECYDVLCMGHQEDCLFADPCSITDINMPWDYLAYAVCFYAGWYAEGDVIEVGDYCRAAYLEKKSPPTVLPQNTQQ